MYIMLNYLHATTEISMLLIMRYLPLVTEYEYAGNRSGSGFRYFPNAQGYRPIIPPTLAVVNGSALHQQSASPSDTDMVSLSQKMHRLTLLSRPQNSHLLVQTQVSHPFLQPLIFNLQLPQFRYAQTGEFLLPVIKNGFRNAHLSADFPDTGAGFGLFQRKRNLFFGIAGLFPGDVPLGEMEERPEASV